MLLKMLTGLSGPDLSLSLGDEHEFDNAEAERLIGAGFAEAIAVAPALKAPATPKAKAKA